MHSIRGHLTLLLVISLGLLLVGSGGVLYTIIRAQLIGEFNRVLLAKAQALITLTDDNGQTIEIDIADKFMPEFDTADNPKYFTLWRASGELIAKSPSLGKHHLPRSPVLPDKPLFQNLVLPDGRSGRLIEIAFVPQVDLDEEDKEKIEQTTETKTVEELETDEVVLDPARFPDRAAVLLVARDREGLDTFLQTLWWSLATTIAGLLVIMVGEWCVRPCGLVYAH